MDALHGLRHTSLLTLLLATATQAPAETLFHCLDARGTPVFSDLPCTRTLPAEVTRRSIELHNVATGMALGDADRRHLDAIDARRPERAHVAGLPDPERVRRCEALRAEREALRETARRGHDGSLLRERRRLHGAIREACN